MIPTKRRRARRAGMVTIEVVMFVATVFVAAMLLYGIGKVSYAGLFQIISSHLGSPYM